MYVATIPKQHFLDITDNQTDGISSQGKTSCIFLKQSHSLYISFSAIKWALFISNHPILYPALLHVDTLTERTYNW